MRPALRMTGDSFPNLLAYPSRLHRRRKSGSERVKNLRSPPSAFLCANPEGTPELLKIAGGRLPSSVTRGLRSAREQFPKALAPNYLHILQEPATNERTV